MADWLGISSSNLDSYCGYTTVNLEDALDGTFFWRHSVEETHWFIIDLGATYTITKVRGRSNELYDPININIYVSDNKESWGDAVATGISSWQDNLTDWVEENTVEKNGRYIKVEILETEQANHSLRFGTDSGPYTIFDAYGEVPSPPAVGNATFFGCNF